MALVSGQQALSSFSDLPSVCSPDDSDDDYVYVSSLAEQIAHALMLDDDDAADEPAPSLSLPSNPFPPELRCRPYCAWPSSSPLLNDMAFESKNAEVMVHPVSHFAAAWRDHGPSEWDCFYTPSLQQASRQLEHSFSKHYHLFRGRNPAHYNRVAACSRETWESRPEVIHKAAYNAASPARKESIGTGVFLPKIINSGSHYRRKAGFSSSKSAYAPRHKY